MMYYTANHAHIQDLAGMAHDDIDPSSVFSIHGDEQKVCI